MLHRAQFSNNDIIIKKTSRTDNGSARDAFFAAFDTVWLTYGGFVVKYAVHRKYVRILSVLCTFRGDFEMGELSVEEKPSVFRGLLEKYHEIIMYCIFGAATTIVNWVIYSACVKIMPVYDYSNGFPSWFQEFIVSRLHLDIKLIYAGIVAWVVAVIFAFVTNKLWVFESKSWKGKLVLGEALTFFGGRIATGLLEVVAVPAFVTWGFNVTLFGIDGLPAKIVVSVAIVILNYILSKFVSFRGPEEKAA